MRYSDDLIEEIRSRSDIVDVVGSYVPLTRKAGNLWGLCPFHGEKTASFSVSPKKQMFYCFGCHKGGNAVTFVMEYENVSFTEAIKILAQRAGIELPEADYSEAEAREKSFRSKMYEINKLAAGYFYAAGKSEGGKRAIEYFTKRGLSQDTILHWGLGYSNPYSDDLYKYLKGKGFEDSFLKETGLFRYSEKGVFDLFWNRAMFPIMDERDRVIAFGGRVMGDGEPKYLNSPETKVFDKSNNLYGLNYAKRSRRKEFLLCEGYMDVISLHQAGFTNAVATLGTALTERHAEKISRYVKEVLLTYDSDGAGTKAALRAIPMLEARGITVRVVNMKPYKDPDEFIKNLGADEYQKRMDEADSSFFFRVRVEELSHNMEDPKEKSDFYKSVCKMLLNIKGDLERKVYEEAFVKKFQVSFKAFDDLLIAEAKDFKPERTEEDKPPVQSPLERFKTKQEKQLDNAVLQPQRLLLTYLSDDPKLFDRISKVLDPSEFSDEIYRRAAEMAYRSCRETGEVNAAKLVNSFEEIEDQEKVGMIFQTELEGELSEAERIKAIEDTVRKIKLSAVRAKIDAALSSNDSVAFAELSKEEARLKNRNIKIM